MKKIISFALSFLLAFHFLILYVFAVTTAKINGEATTTITGQYIKIPIEIDNNHGLMAYKLIFEYDSDYLRPVSAEKGDVITFGQFEDSIDSSDDGEFYIIWIGSENMTSNGTIAYMYFEAINPIASTKIKVSYSKDDTFNENWEDVCLSCSDINVSISAPTSVTAKGYIEGDAVSGEQAFGILEIKNITESSYSLNLSIDNSVALVNKVYCDNAGIRLYKYGDCYKVEITDIAADLSSLLIRFDLTIADSFSGKASIPIEYKDEICGYFNLSAVPAGNSILLYSEQIKGAIGETVDIPIFVKHCSNLMGYRLNFMFDESCLEVISVQNSITEGGNFDDSMGTLTGTFDVVWNNTSALTRDCQLLLIKVKIIEASPTTISVTYSSEDTFDEQWNDVTFACRPIEINIPYTTAEHEHRFCEWTITKSATCTEDGEKQRKCTGCDETEYEVIEKLGHDFDTGVTIPPTTTSEGYTLYTCKRDGCGYSYKTNFVDPIHIHSFTVLQSDGTNHWYKCAACDAISGKEAHKGGTATCTAKAFCSVCSIEYGELKSHSFTVLEYDGTNHWYKCATCDVISGKEAHKGGTATCTAKAVCSVCSKEYGELNPHSFTVLKSDGTNHWYKCATCDAISGKEAHKGGTATCTAKAVCSVCSNEYGDLKAHSFTVLQSDGIKHWYKCENCDTISGKEAHKGGIATCTEKAKCSVCSAEYGELKAHIFIVLLSDETYHWYECANCDERSGQEIHYGGNATCTEKAVCAVCSKEYGELKSHSFTVLQSDGTNHWYKCANCDAISGKEAHKGGTATCTAKALCSVCSKEYGELKSHSFTVLQSDGTDHWYKCTACDAISGKEAHKGGTATCTTKAVCSVCSKEYGEMKSHSFTILQSDGTDHWYKCANCTAISGKEAHKGGTATCTTKAVCSVCSKEYGELKSHSFTLLQSDGTKHWFKCADCTAISGKESHKGGTATCTAKAVCSVCSKEYGELKSHSFTVLQSDGTDHWYKCTACDVISGKEAHKGGTATCKAKAKCSVCSKEYGTALGHDYASTFTIDKAATCTAAGSKSKHCSRCSATTEVTSIPATGHKYDNACDTICNTCGATRTITHAWNGGTINKAATCTAKGVKTYTCSVCKATKTEEVVALGHDYMPTVTKPTCTSDGYTTYTCSRCKDTYTGNTVKATGHQWNTGVITVEPTAEKEGVKTYTCLICGSVKTEAVEKLVSLFNIGDVDDDGKITAADARLALRASVGLKGDKDVHGLTINCDDKTSRAFKAADVDFDDKISAADARLILRASVGLEDPKDWKKA